MQELQFPRDLPEIMELRQKLTMFDLIVALLSASPFLAAILVIAYAVKLLLPFRFSRTPDQVSFSFGDHPRRPSEDESNR
jgi:hypothetical protein